MPRLPQPGQDSGQWGDLLNEYLRQTHTESGTLKDNIVTANTIANGAITEANLAPAVTTKLNDTSTTVTDNSVTTAKLVDSSITTAKIAPNAITNTQIADGSVSEAKLSSAVVTKLNATGSSTPADGSITTTKLADNSVTSAKIVDGTIAETDLAAAVVTKLNAAGSSTPADGSITTAKLADANVTTAKLADANVTTAKLADNSVTSAKIVDGTIAETDLAAAVVTKLNAAGSSTPADGSITTAKLADANVTTAKLADNSVTSAKIVDGTIAETDLASAVVTKLNASGSSATGKVLTNFQNPDGTWSLDSTALSQARSSGYKILWLSRPNLSAPTPAINGVADDDVLKAKLSSVPAVPVAPTVLPYPGGIGPGYLDADGTANDAIILTKVAGAKWRIGTNPGVDYTEASFGASISQSIPNSTGAAVEVALMPSGTNEIFAGTPVWYLGFTNAATGGVVRIPKALYPKMQDAADTANDSVIIYKVPNVTWDVAGTSYPSSSMTGDSQTVLVTTGTTATVTATADSGWTINGTASWAFDFTNVASGGISWKTWLSLDFNEAEKTFTANERYGGDMSTIYMAGSAGVRISNNRLVVPVSSSDGRLSCSRPAATAKVRMSFDVPADFDPYGRHVVYFMGATGKQSIGFILGQNSMKFGETGDPYWGLMTATTGLPATTWSINDRLMIELDNAANTVKTFVNGALAQTYTITNTNRSTWYAPAVYCSSLAQNPFVIDNFVAEDYK
jgi:uncharacterized protein YjbI with pentapeptide repeats